jgi:dihydrofolate reductase
MKISIIAAIDSKNGIGKNRTLPWSISKDFGRFKNITMGHVVLMGQKTYDSIGKPLPGRITVVVSSDPGFNLDLENAYVCRTLESGIQKAKELEKEEVFICGGGSIYSQTIDIADKLYLTIVEGNFDADVFFPEYDNFKNIISESEDNEGEYKFKFLELSKK